MTNNITIDGFPFGTRSHLGSLHDWSSHAYHVRASILFLRMSGMPVLVSSLGYLALVHVSPFSFNSSVRRRLLKVGRNGVLVQGFPAIVWARFNGIEQSSHAHHSTIIGKGSV